MDNAAAPSNTATTTFTLTIPATTATGHDLYVPAVSRDHTAGTALATLTDDDTGGNTWTLLTNSTDRKGYLWWKKATSGTASKTVTFAGGVGSSTGGLTVFSGGASGDPTTNLVLEDNASGNETHAGFTPDEDNSQVCIAVLNVANDQAVTNGTWATFGYQEAEQWENESTGGSDCGAIFYSKLQAGTAAGTGAFTWEQTNQVTISISFAIKPSTATTETRTHTTDALLRKTSTRTHTTDALLKKSQTKTHTTDALLTTGATKTHTTDALVKKLQTKTHTTDAFLVNRVTKTHTTDSALKKLQTKVHTTDALLTREVIYHHASVTSAVTATDTTFVNALNVPAGDISTAGFVNNDEVLLLVWVQPRTTATVQVDYRVKYNGSVITSGAANPGAAMLSGARRHLAFMDRIDLATIADFDVEVASTTTDDVSLQKVEFAIVRLSDLGTEGTDWVWNKSTTDVAHTTTYSGTSRAALTIPTSGATQDWVIFAYSHIAVDSTGVNAEVRVTVDGSVTAGDWSHEGLATTEEWTNVLFDVANLNTSTHTVALESRDDATGVNNHRESSLIAFRKNTFPDFAYDEPGTVSVASTGADVSTLTPTFSDDWGTLIFGTGNIDINSSNASAWIWVIKDGSEVLQPITDIASGNHNSTSWDSTDEPVLFWMGHDVFTAGAIDLKLHVDHTESTARDLLRTKFMVWPLAPQVVVVTETETHTTDALILKRSTKTHTTDALIVHTGIPATTLTIEIDTAGTLTTQAPPPIENQGPPGTDAVPNQGPGATQTARAGGYLMKVYRKTRTGVIKRE